MRFNLFNNMWNYWIFGLFVLLLISLYVANDASKFGQNGFLWAAIVIFMPMMGFILYIFVRSGWSKPQQIYQKDRSMSMRSNIQTSPPRQERVVSSYSDQFGNNKYSGKDNVTENNLFCTICGTENKIEASYCRSCGENIKRRVR